MYEYEWIVECVVRTHAARNKNLKTTKKDTRH